VGNLWRRRITRLRGIGDRIILDGVEQILWRVPRLLREVQHARRGELGLNTHVIVDGCRGIERERGDIGCALDEMKRAGAILLKSSDL
jgi:hypothetical protein